MEATLEPRFLLNIVRVTPGHKYQTEGSSQLTKQTNIREGREGGLFLICVCVRVQSCPTLCDPVNCSPSGSSVDGISHAISQRIVEWVAISYVGASV